MNQAINIFTFTNYRTFLKSYADDRKERSDSWSYGVWAKKLGLAGSPVITMVVNGKRHPGKNLAAKLADYFKFSEQERDYFFDLIRLEKVSDDPQLSVLLMERMGRLSPNGIFKRLDDVAFSTISKWYYYAIREMVHLHNFKEDIDYIVNSLEYKVTPSEVKKAIFDLIAVGLLERDSEGKLVPSVGRYNTDNDVASEGLKRFHESMIDLGKKSLRQTPVNEREIQGLTITINDENLPKAKEAIRRFKNEFESLFEVSPGNRTYQMNVQFFPLTKKIENISGDKNEVH